MKESIVLIGAFLFYLCIFKSINILISIELKVLLIISMSFFTVMLIFVNKKNIKINFKYEFIKKTLIEFLFFLLISLLYAKIMKEYFGQHIFSYYYADVLIFSPFLVIFYLGLVSCGYKRKEDVFFYGDKRKLIPKFLIKIFFLTFIYGSLSICLTEILTIPSFNINQVDYYIYLLGLTFDVLIALFGYTFASHWFCNRVESIDNSLKGWLVCIICYPPFLYFYKILLSQVDNYTWGDWAKGQWYYYPWLILIMTTWLLYWVSNAHFGFKFANLSWRGLVDQGLYKHFRHPSYLFKNIYWWAYTVPFFGVMGFDLIHNFLAMSAISLIYYLRAKTEEKHLLRFPEYQQYYQWVEQHGFFAKIKKWLKIH
ncbi:isoprenylcysteine carboxylmethyltransferase family protein [Acinetobacter sp. YH12043]|uniref:isoprenylcysteine carboxylmethyltransferase family protein n=1 Tax=Acinetobacter sp. YH12043 TaxID=2601050 RepID=UPI0015D28B8D|nr:isoprenylcysteine carboxylmethyltransferase family protein [Acinetobacter sp. YH12043]